MSDFDLIKRAGQGDEEAFKELFEKHQTFVWNVSYRMTYDFDDAEDIAQEVFIKVWKNISKFRGSSRFSTWVYRITVNSALNRLNKTGRNNSIFDEGAMAHIDTRKFMSQNPEASLTQIEDERVLAGLLAKLDNERRMVIILREIEGLSYEEIAETTGAPIGTVRSRIARGRKDLEAMAALMEEGQ
ncbi:RNA polymerase sigma factor RpoE [hydrothermal vent metagenome]|uniref:RNA polymerase sigma factor RpoE n=1 Tax=hydrothermal vent metagenome TaxID=652676 RepID=A0A3B1BVJ2_9ZZZZ